MARYRKVIKTGNSLSITLPAKVSTEMNIQEGDIALVKINRTKSSITYIFTGHPKQLSLIQHSKKK